MKKSLVLTKVRVWHFDGNGTRVEGPHKDIWGDVSRIWGDESGVCGDVTGLCGDVTGLCGDVSGLRGDVDMCEITDAEREAGVDISYLILGKED